LPKPPCEENRRDAEQRDERLPERLPGHEQRSDANDPTKREQPSPLGPAANIVVNRPGGPERYHSGTRQHHYSNKPFQYFAHDWQKVPLDLISFIDILRWLRDANADTC
jgi:hypothetical protein